MQFRFDLEITEQDYLDFNNFHITRSPYRQTKLSGLNKMLFAVIGFCALLYLLAQQYGMALFLLLFGLAYFLFMKPFMRFTTKCVIKQQQKTGKMGFSPKAVLEFAEDCITETTLYQKTEYRYAGIERISVLDQKAIYLHLDAVRAFILPMSCFASPEQKDAFIEFIKTKCPVVDTYN